MPSDYSMKTGFYVMIGHNPNAGGLQTIIITTTVRINDGWNSGRPGSSEGTS